MLIELLALTLITAQSGGPSFDCEAAFEPVEDAICTDDKLSALDLRMADRYAAVRRALPAGARTALAADQRWFLGSRDEWFDNRDRWSDFPDLASRMTDRIDFLNQIDSSGAGGLTGRWRNVAGEVVIRPGRDGGLTVSISAANPVNARWVCEVNMSGRASGPATARSVEGVADGDPAYRLKATLGNGVLRIDETRTRGSGGPGYCGANGGVGGAYFRVY
ncbi:hypothetical protein BH10PSE1_BH10PSE1_31870 [soil metagenome]